MDRCSWNGLCPVPWSHAFDSSEAGRAESGTRKVAEGDPQGGDIGVCVPAQGLELVVEPELHALAVEFRVGIRRVPESHEAPRHLVVRLPLGLLRSSPFRLP